MPVFGMNYLRRRRERRIGKGSNGDRHHFGLRSGVQYTVDPQLGQK